MEEEKTLQKPIKKTINKKANIDLMPSTKSNPAPKPAQPQPKPQQKQPAPQKPTTPNQEQKNEKTVEDKKLIESLFFIKEKGLQKEKPKIKFQTVKEAENSAIEDISGIINEKINSIKQDISELQKKGNDLGIEGLKLLQVPLKLKVWESSREKKDLEKVFSIIEEVIYKVNPVKKKQEEKDLEAERREKEKEKREKELQKIKEQNQKKDKKLIQPKQPTPKQAQPNQPLNPNPKTSPTPTNHQIPTPTKTNPTKTTNPKTSPIPTKTNPTQSHKNPNNP